MYKILHDGETLLVGDVYIFNIVYKILVDKDFKSVFIKKMEEEEEKDKPKNDN